MIEEEKALEEIIERATKKGELVSDQDQYQIGSPDTFFSSVMRFSEEDETPRYKPKSRTRDQWLLRFVRNEPHLNGVLGTATSLVANRGWKLIGGRNLVNSVRVIRIYEKR